MRALVLFVALALPAQAETVVAARTVRAQAILMPEDVALIEAEIPGAASAADQVIGLEARVMLYPGRPILLEQLGPPAVIERNQIVLLVFQTGGLRIETDGRALARAAVGDRVRVMNLDSRKTVSGRVAPDGAVLVGQ